MKPFRFGKLLPPSEGFRHLIQYSLRGHPSRKLEIKIIISLWELRLTSSIDIAQVEGRDNTSYEFPALEFSTSLLFKYGETVLGDNFSSKTSFLFSNFFLSCARGSQCMSDLDHCMFVYLLSVGASHATACLSLDSQAPGEPLRASVYVGCRSDNKLSN